MYVSKCVIAIDKNKLKARRLYCYKDAQIDDNLLLRKCIN